MEESKGISLDPHPSLMSEGALANPQSWRPGLRNTPWLAVAALLLSIACTVASVLTIVTSNNQPVSSWRIQPAVVLAIISSVLHIALSFAISRAGDITWWRSAVRGTTINQLYYIWSPISHWRSLKSAISSGRESRKILFATVIVYTANILSAPLFQRATHIRNGSIIKNATLEFDMVERLPTAYIGNADYTQFANASAATTWASISQQWYAKTTILTPSQPEYHCNGRCEGHIKGTGAITNCSSTTVSVDLSDPANNGTQIFAVNFTRQEDTAHMPTFTVMVTHAESVDNGTCVATIIKETCDVRVASVQYPVTIENQTIKLNLDKYPNRGDLDPYLSDSLNTSQGELTGPLGGLSWTFGSYWYSYVYFYQSFDRDMNKSLYLTRMGGLVSSQYSNFRKMGYNNGTCIHSFRQPTRDILDSIYQIMFRAGLYLAAANDTRNIPVEQSTQALMYQSQYHWLGIAVVIVIISSFCCAIPLWRGWELGRKVTLNPIETARAFNVPKFRMADLGCSAKDIIKDIGGVHVQYMPILGHDTDGNPIPGMELRPMDAQVG